MSPLLALMVTAEFLAGTARVEITPPAGHAMAGYGARKGAARAVHDPLYATVLVLKTPQQSLALVTADLVFAHSPRLEAAVETRFGMANVLLASSHTHSGPDTTLGDAWWRETEDKMIAAVGEAARNLAPARIGAGTGRVYIAHNRRRVLSDGRVEMLWRNAEKLPTSPVDPTVSALRIDDAGGNPRAILVNYSCHPTVLGPENLDISADYVGAMRAYVEKQLPGARVLFALGASGDINPDMDGGSFEDVRSTGETLGQAVAKIVSRITTRDGTLQFAAKIHTFDHRFNAGETVPIAMGVGLLGGSVGFVSLSADPFVDHQIRLRDRGDCQATFLFAHTSTKGVPYARYLPTIRAAAEGGYGADSATIAEPGAGEILIDRAIVQLLKFMGRLKPVPDLRY